MENKLLLKILTLFIMAWTLVSYSHAQTTDSNSTADGLEGSGSGNTDETEVTTEKGTTADPCGSCLTSTMPCPGDCECPDNKIRNLELVCAEPCNGTSWCRDGLGCEPSTEDPGYICIKTCGGTPCTGNGQICSSDNTCVCPLNFYLNDEKDCVTASIFGGMMTFNNTLDNYDETEQNVLIVLNAMFNITPAFIRADVLTLESGSVIAKYKLIYGAKYGVTDSDVTEAFDLYTEGDCGDSKDSVNTTAGPLECSSRSTVVDPMVACNNFEVNLNCDPETASCSNSNGSTECVCNDTERSAKPYPQANYCTVATCIINNDCNPPFGTCREGDPNDADILSNYCECTVFGWSGTYCTNPWEFVFTIVTAGLGVILICVLTACIVTTRKGKTVQKAPKHEDMDLQNPFVDFQPGIVRAKAPTNAYSLSDSYEATNGSQSHTNGAFNANEGSQNLTSTFSGDQRRSGKNDYEYF